MGIYGQDWASYQPAAPSTSGLSFAFIKVTEGETYTNPEWTSQRSDAHAAGLVVGLYHYPHMANSPQQEADYFLRVAQPQPGEMVCLDWEGYDSANSRVSHATQLAYKEAWLRYVKGRLPHNPVGMYCNTDYWNNVDTTGYVQDYLWIATSGRAAGNPGIRANWMFHQYADSGSTDQDYCRLGSTAELHAWAQGFAPTPTPTPTPPTPEDDMPYSEQDLTRIITAAVTASPVRDTLAFANYWWLIKAINGETVPGTDPNTWGWLQAPLAAALQKLAPGQQFTAGQLAELQTAVAAAIKDAVVKVEISNGAPSSTPGPTAS